MAKTVLRRLPALDLNQRYTKAEGCEYLRISLPYLDKQIAAGKIPVIRDGRRVYISGRTIAERSGLPPGQEPNDTPSAP